MINPTIAGLGPIMQLAYVPRDLDAAIAFWTRTMGAGPFFRLAHIAYKAATYRGQPSDVDFSVLIGYWGDMQIELIEQHNDAPSIYSAWTDAGQEGLHHVCLVVDDIGNARAVCATAGATVAQEIFLDGYEAFYVDTGGAPLELRLPRSRPGPARKVPQGPDRSPNARRQPWAGIAFHQAGHAQPRP